MATQSPTPPLLTASEVGRALRVSRQVVYDRLASGAIRGYRLGSGPKARWRVPPEALVHYLEGNPKEVR